MIPVYQTRFGEDGNCIQACVSSILDGRLSIAGIPHVRADEEANGWIIIERYLQSAAGLRFQHLSKGWMEGVRPIGYHIIGGKGPRGCQHAVVGYEGLMVFDPHPEGGGLTRIDDWTLLVPCAPTEPLPPEKP